MWEIILCFFVGVWYLLVVVGVKFFIKVFWCEVVGQVGEGGGGVGDCL